MAPTIPTIEPTSFVLGNTVQWTRSLSDFPAPTYALTYSFVNAGGQFAVTGTADGATHAMTISAETSAALTAGVYHWQAYATSGTTRFLAGSGTTEALPDFAVETSGYDDRSHVKKTLDAIEAVLEGKASKDQLASSVNGISITRLTPAELLVWRDKYLRFYRQELADERSRQGLPSGKKIRTRF